ncbi:MAG: aminoacyl--tRNA ligase-related protein [Candidatus Saccharimonadales bacterium]
MKLSQLFTKTRKDAPKDEVSKNAQLLIRAGFIHKEMAGVYTYLPLGLKVLNKVEDIIREEMDGLGGQEVLLTALQRQGLWEKTDRWGDDKVDIWFKTQLENDNNLGLGWTHEEPLVNALLDHVSSYKDLPLQIYQIQTKFRRELRAKSGIMRGREFLMKDMYTFARNQKEHEELYKKIQDSYVKIFEKFGLGDKTFLTFASGGIFSEFSHEYQTLTDAGEDTIYLDRERGLAVNQEVYNDEVLAKLELQKDKLEEVRAAEVGNVFSLGTKFSEPIGLTYTDESGEEKEVIMGCYGIGVSRVMGVIAEVFADNNGLAWPESVAPAQIHLVPIGNLEVVTKKADELYESLSKKHEVIYDDREESAGTKLADADLIGVPIRLVISEKTLATGSVEIKRRTEEKTELVKFNQLDKFLG